MGRDRKVIKRAVKSLVIIIVMYSKRNGLFNGDFYVTLLMFDLKVCDLSIDHPSASKQHAVFQYRF